MPSTSKTKLSKKQRILQALSKRVYITNRSVCSKVTCDSQSSMFWDSLSNTMYTADI